MNQLEGAVQGQKTKSVLVCLGNVNRAISFPEGSVGDEKKALFDGIKAAFSDILDDNNRITKPIFLVKNEEWRNEFVDIGDGVIPDRAVVRVVEAGEVAIPAKAVNIAARLCKPNEGEAKALSQLFPSSSSNSSGSKRPRAIFDPTAELCVAEQKRKKKAANSQGRPVNVKVMVLKSFTPYIPRGRPRNILKKEGREKTLPFRRSMNADEVRCTIARGIPHISSLKEKNWTYLQCDSDNHLEVSKNQVLNGSDVINRKGSLYICPAQTITEPSQSSDAVASQQAIEASSSATSTDSIDRANCVVLTDSSSDSDTDLPPSGLSLSEQRRSTAPQSRSDLIAEQDSEFRNALRIDQQKAMEERKARERKEVLQAIKDDLVHKFENYESTSGTRTITFRLPDCTRSFNFKESAPILELYEYVFSVCKVERYFTIYKTFPREAIEITGTIQSSSIEGVLSVSFEADSPDPHNYLHVNDMIGEEAKVDEESSVAGDINVLHQAEAKRIGFMHSLHLKRGEPHVVNRAAIFDSVTDIYKSSAPLDEYPFRIKYKNERAFDTGGVARDMFSAFYDDVYNRMFDGASLLIPALLPHIDISAWPLLGTIISHSYLACGILPIRIAFPCLSCVLLNRGDQLPQEILTETFVDSLSHHDALTFKCAFQEVKDGKEKFKSCTQSTVFSVLSRYGCRELPTPANIYRLVNQVAKYQFLMVPSCAYSQMKSGIPSAHQNFWNSMSIGELYSLYKALHASPSKILELIEEPDFDNPAQQRVFNFLCDFAYI